MTLPWRRNLRDGRFGLLAAALLLALAALAAPPLPLTRDGVRVLAVVDITGSMNVRDYSAAGQPQSRLEAAKTALRHLLAGLPCGSRFALGLFTERRPFLLFAPVEVCENFAPLDGAVAALDWRMAWEADSRVAAGLYRSVTMAGEIGSDLLFLTDGQEAPPLPAGRTPSFEGAPGAVRGLIVGVGGYALSPIPKFNDRGRETGFYAETEVQQENRFGPPPADAETREGYNPRNAPFGAQAAHGSEHLSSVREPYLRDLAARTGLAYAHLDGPASLDSPLRAAATARPVPGQLDLRPFLGTTALLLALAAFAAGPLRARSGRLTLRKA
ncbi:VWA domain-containing protein [Methylobacterium radiodurans]|uniref:VWA domain-containing protein n=1 Tax=Methylobacterium radiodurans TaxID=2202828 RepID=A0A2U8VZM0_9HYPH|nr:VWA domain-containing protein [Methylobacterium radiodurans]AWN38690.1 VWA domain-containing protein [Methylobacterium radiodurans]